MFNFYDNTAMTNNRKLQFLLETKLSIDEKVPKTGRLLRNKIFVIGFPPNCTENDLEKFFSNFGLVRETRIVKDENGITKGYAFITFAKERSVVHALEYRGPLYFMDRKLSINPAVKQPHQSIPMGRCRSSSTSIDTPSDISNSSNYRNHLNLLINPTVHSTPDGIALHHYYHPGGSHPFFHVGVPSHPMFCTSAANPMWYHHFPAMANCPVGSQTFDSNTHPYLPMGENNSGLPMISHLHNGVNHPLAFGYAHLHGNE